MTDTSLYWLWLSSLPEVSLQAKSVLLEVFGSPKEAFYAPSGAYSKIEGISKRDASLLEARDLTLARIIPERCEEEGITILTPEEEAYPVRLKQIYAPPAALYVKGHLPTLDKEVPVAVIGTRKASTYGLKMGRSMAYELSKCGAVIVSGLTMGIDAAAAEGALAAGGVCIGVLGTPIEAAKSRLAISVCLKGALISEYAPGTPLLKPFFRARNRIASGISCGVVVVEAPEKSGTRLFVAEALEQGKEIFAVPGNADSETSAGTIRFLREGAQLVTRGWEVAEELDSAFSGVLDPTCHEKFPVYDGSPASADETKTETVKEIKKGRKENDSPKKRLDKQESPCYIDITDAISTLSEIQQQIMLAILAGHSSAEEIIETTLYPAKDVLVQLTLLEIRGLIRRDSVKGIVPKEAH
ncbi:MAG: DNA-protecting protein DprA [Oscillospiraceae bacterium]|nr:DNA-protecting protein DprA [Oscillospiraceae bacterium]